MPMLAVVRPFGLVPTTGWDDEQKAKYPLGATVYLIIKKGRSPRMQRFYWGLIDHVANAIGYDKDSLSDELMIRTGRIDVLEFKNGTIHTRPKRISKMGHVEFRAYVDAAISLICDEYVSEMSPGQLLRDVEAMLNITYSDAFADKNKKENADALQ